MQVEARLPDPIAQSPHALVVSHRSALFVFLCLLWPFPAKVPLENFANSLELRPGEKCGLMPLWRDRKLRIPGVLEERTTRQKVGIQRQQGEQNECGAAYPCRIKG